MRNAIEVLLTTIVAVFCGTLTTAVIFFFIGEADYALLGVVWTIGNLFIPTLIAVLIFRFLRSITYQTNTIKGLLKQGLKLMIILFIGILIWSVLDVVFSFPLNAFFFKIRENFESQFLGYIPATVTISLAIPFTVEVLQRFEEKPIKEKVLE